MNLNLTRSYILLKALLILFCNFSPRFVRIKTMQAELSIMVTAANQSVDENESFGSNKNRPADASIAYVKKACVE